LILSEDQAIFKSSQRLNKRSTPVPAALGFRYSAFGLFASPDLNGSAGISPNDRAVASTSMKYRPLTCSADSSPFTILPHKAR
jgi:hypothetical protein